jgi:TRAP transporter TAXI family solute receptor
MRKALALAGAAVLLAGALTGCGGRRDGATTAAGDCAAGSGRVTIATGNSTGVYYTMGGGLAQVIEANTDLSATAAETGASVQNIEQLVAGEYDIAFSLADTAADAVQGKASFTSPQPVAALARIHANYTHVVVRTDSGINAVADMAGKRISTGSPRSGTEVIANRLLTAAGVDPASGVSAQRLDLTKTVDGMKDGSIDGLFWSGGLPTSAMTDLFTTLGDKVKFIDVTPLLEPMKQVNPVYDRAAIPAETYKTATETPTIVVPNVLLVKNDFAEGNACALTKLLFDKKADLVAVHPAADEISTETAAKTDPVPLHPGAQRALTELGATG